jgi:hypothetical protein
MRIFLSLICILCLNGCTITSGLTMGASAASSLFDRYEKHKIERRLKELEKEIQGKNGYSYVDVGYGYSNGGSY